MSVLAGPTEVISRLSAEATMSPALRRSRNVFADAVVPSALWCEVSTTVAWMLTVLVNPVGSCRRATSILVDPTEVILGSPLTPQCLSADVAMSSMSSPEPRRGNVCWQLRPFAFLVHSAFVPVAGVPLHGDSLPSVRWVACSPSSIIMYTARHAVVVRPRDPGGFVSEVHVHLDSWSARRR